MADRGRGGKGTLKLMAMRGTFVPPSRGKKGELLRPRRERGERGGQIKWQLSWEKG